MTLSRCDRTCEATSVLTALILLGSLGLLVLVAGLVFGDLLDGVFDVALPGDLGTGVPAATGAALTAFGYGSALALTSADLPAGASLGLGAAGAVVVGGVSYRMAKALIGTPVEPHRTSSLYGVFGSVVTAIPADGFGEVALVHGGERRKISARAESPLPAGTQVYVVEILSETAVAVAPATPVLPDPKELPE